MAWEENAEKVGEHTSYFRYQVIEKVDELVAALG